MLKLNPNVKLANFTPQMALATSIVNACYQNVGVKYVLITFGSDGIHGAGSLHPKGNALDFRTKHVPREKLRPLKREIMLALGPDFDVILEDVGGNNEHLHVEYDPE